MNGAGAVAFGAGVVLALAGCSGSSSSPPPAGGEDGYRQFLGAYFTHPVDRATIVRIARERCRGSDLSLKVAYSLALDDRKHPDSPIVVREGVHYLCPERLGVLQSVTRSP